LAADEGRENFVVTLEADPHRFKAVRLGRMSSPYNEDGPDI
jgi:hypothetical protein